MEPQLFQSAIEDQLERLKDEREAKDQVFESSGSEDAAPEAGVKDSGELVLYQRMEELKAKEVSARLEDLMYLCILEKFLLLDVEMLPRMEGFVNAPTKDLKPLTEGIHSKEAVELVREHLLSIMGNAAAPQFSNAVMKMSKLQMAQVYAASIMFGYFLRRVDRRFQLERSMGTLTPSREETVARLEQLFHDAEAREGYLEGTDQSDEESPVVDTSTSDKERVSSSTTSSSSTTPVKQGKSALRRYVETFDQETMVNTARVVSAEGAALVERQTTALMGDIKHLQTQMQEVVGSQAISYEDLMERMAKAVEQDTVETLTMTVGTQRHAVLEALAYGTFLRDVESWVQADYGLLTPTITPLLPPGSSGAGGAAGPDGPAPAGGGSGGALA